MCKNVKGLDYQQGSLISWLAGIIDGEGWVGLDRRAGKNRKGFRIAMQVSNQDPRILKRCEEILKHYYGIKCYFGKHISVKNRPGISHFWIVGMKLEPLLRDLKELCVSKVSEISIMLEYVEYKKPQLVNYSERFSGFDFTKEEEFYRRLRQVRETRPFRDYTLLFPTQEDDIVQSNNEN